MTPNTENNILINNVETVTEQPNKTYYLDKEKNIISGFCDDLEAIKQTIYCILNTERFDHLIYSWNYGIEAKHLIGENSAFVVPELERVIKEALLQDTRIIDVNNFSFEIIKNKIIATFTVMTTLGTLEMERVVNI